MNPEFPSSERVNNLFNLQGVPQVSQILKEKKKIILENNLGSVFSLKSPNRNQGFRRVQVQKSPDAKNILQKSPVTPSTPITITESANSSENLLSTPKSYNIKKTLSQVFPAVDQPRSPFNGLPKNNLPLLKKNGTFFVPPPDYFKHRRTPKTPNYRSNNWKPNLKEKFFSAKKKSTQSKQIMMPRRHDVDLDDFNTLLTKRLVENLEEGDVEKGNYTVKKGSYCLIIKQENNIEKKREILSDRDIDIKVKDYEDMLPGPYMLGHVRAQEKKGMFKRKDILKFEKIYKKQLYDTFIKYGKYYQAATPVKKLKKTTFLKSEVVFGLPSFNEEEVESPPKLVIDIEQNNHSEESTSDGDGVNAVRGSPFKTDNAKKNIFSPSKIINSSYINEDSHLYREPTIENLYTKRRNINDFLVWDPELAKDEEVIDMIDQVLDEFREVPNNPVTRHKLYDYLIKCNLDKELFLDQLEADHIDFRRFVQQLMKGRKGN